MKFTQQEWDALIARYPRGMAVAGIVTSIAPFGVFVRLDELPDVPALLEVIHFGIRESEADRRAKFPDDYPPVGTRLQARILAWCLLPKDVRLTQLSHLEWVHSECLAQLPND